jgi:hypothetical protein
VPLAQQSSESEDGDHDREDHDCEDRDIDMSESGGKRLKATSVLEATSSIATGAGHGNGKRSDFVGWKRGEVVKAAAACATCKAAHTRCMHALPEQPADGDSNGSAAGTDLEEHDGDSDDDNDDDDDDDDDVDDNGVDDNGDGDDDGDGDGDDIHVLFNGGGGGSSERDVDGDVDGDVVGDVDGDVDGDVAASAVAAAELSGSSSLNTVDVSDDEQSSTCNDGTDGAAAATDGTVHGTWHDAVSNDHLSAVTAGTGKRWAGGSSGSGGSGGGGGGGTADGYDEEAVVDAGGEMVLVELSDGGASKSSDAGSGCETSPDDGGVESDGPSHNRRRSRSRDRASCSESEDSDGTEADEEYQDCRSSPSPIAATLRNTAADDDDVNEDTLVLGLPTGRIRRHSPGVGVGVGAGASAGAGAASSAKTGRGSDAVAMAATSPHGQATGGGGTGSRAAGGIGGVFASSSGRTDISALVVAGSGATSQLVDDRAAATGPTSTQSTATGDAVAVSSPFSPEQRLAAVFGDDSSSGDDDDGFVGFAKPQMTHATQTAQSKAEGAREAPNAAPLHHFVAANSDKDVDQDKDSDEGLLGMEEREKEGGAARATIAVSVDDTAFNAPVLADATAVTSALRTSGNSTPPACPLTF